LEKGEIGKRGQATFSQDRLIGFGVTTRTEKVACPLFPCPLFLVFSEIKMWTNAIIK